MDLFGHMTTFTRIVEAGSLSAASRSQGVSLAAISRQLTALEAELGTSLVLRTTRRMMVTEAGRRFYEHAVRLLRDVDEARRSVASTSDVAGTLTVSSSVSFGLGRVGPHLPALFARYPAIDILLRLEDSVIDLVAEGVDVAIRVGVDPPDSDALQARLIGAWPRLVVAAPSYLRARGTPSHPDDLARHDALLRGGSRTQTWSFWQGSRELRADVRGPLRMNALQGLHDACVAGLGVAILPSWLVAEARARGDVTTVLEGFTLPPVKAYAVHRVELRKSPRVRAFVEHLKSAYALEASAAPPASELASTAKKRPRRSARSSP
jgi:DNA-binding transcriptional LysR family regulator